MKLWKWIISVIIGILIGRGLLLGFDHAEATVILAAVLLTAGLYSLDLHYLERGPQTYLKDSDPKETKGKKQIKMRRKRKE